MVSAGSGSLEVMDPAWWRRTCRDSAGFRTPERPAPSRWPERIGSRGTREGASWLHEPDDRADRAHRHRPGVVPRGAGPLPHGRDRGDRLRRRRADRHGRGHLHRRLARPAAGGVHADHDVGYLRAAGRRHGVLHQRARPRPAGPVPHHGDAGRRQVRGSRLAPVGARGPRSRGRGGARPLHARAGDRGRRPLHRALPGAAARGHPSRDAPALLPGRVRRVLARRHGRQGRRRPHHGPASRRHRARRGRAARPPAPVRGGGARRGRAGRAHHRVQRLRRHRGDGRAAGPADPADPADRGGLRGRRGTRRGRALAGQGHPEGRPSWSSSTARASPRSSAAALASRCSAPPDRWSTSGSARPCGSTATES